MLQVRTNHSRVQKLQFERRLSHFKTPSCRGRNKSRFSSFFRVMALRTVSIPTSRRFDWKAAGYLTSIASVLFLGAAAWLKQSPPWWYHPALVIGMMTSICGMGFRYKSHLEEKREIRKAEDEAELEPKRKNTSLQTTGSSKRRRH